MVSQECFVYTSAIGSALELPCYPDEVSDSISVNWNEQSIIGRTPILAYNNTSLRNISFTLNLHRDMYYGYQGSYSDYNSGYVKIETTLRILRGSAYPEYTSKGLQPPMVIFKFGSLMIKGVIKSVNFQWRKPIIDEKYSVCSVNINMDEITDPKHSEGSGMFSSENPNDLTKNSTTEWIEI